MKFIRFFAIGVLFGVVMTKSEAVSWFRIQEMFRFQSFHMYGIIGSALATAILLKKAIKHFGTKNMEGNPITFEDKARTMKRYLFGGTLFGVGWAMTGACPGPLYTLVGNGFLVFAVVISSAVFGTFLYGLLRDKLPH